jgi:hypothetical protein
MAHHELSLLRETLKIWFQYLGVGIASIPAGVLYVLLLRSKVSQNLAIAVCAVTGLLLVFFSWRVIDKRLWSNRSSGNLLPQDVVTDSQFSRLMNEKYETRGSRVQ